MWFILLGIAVLLAGYIFIVRPRIRNVPRFASFFEKAEYWERLLWEKSRTIFLARIVTGVGLLIGVHDFVMPFLLAVDLQPLIPEEYRAIYPIALAVIGPTFEWLRKVTDEPIEDKE